jgi:hypothetical protein
VLEDVGACACYSNGHCFSFVMMSYPLHALSASRRTNTAVLNFFEFKHSREENTPLISIFDCKGCIKSKKNGTSGALAGVGY